MCIIPIAETSCGRWCEMSRDMTNTSRGWAGASRLRRRRRTTMCVLLDTRDDYQSVLSITPRRHSALCSHTPCPASVPSSSSSSCSSSSSSCSMVTSSVNDLRQQSSECMQHRRLVSFLKLSLFKLLVCYWLQKIIFLPMSVCLSVWVSVAR